MNRHLEQIGVDLNLLWSRIYDLILKTFLSVDPIIVNQLRKYNNNSTKNNCFELYGFDVLIDSDLKPWLLEVNLSPSLATDSQLDYHIKNNLITETFNITGIKKFDRRRDNISKMKQRVSNIMKGQKNSR